MYSGYRIALDRKGTWSFNDDFARNFVIFGENIVHHLILTSSSSSSHLKNDFLTLGEGDTFGVNGNFGAPEKKINSSKAKAKLCLSLHYKSDNSYLFVNEKEICKFTASNKNDFLSQFYLGI